MHILTKMLWLAVIAIGLGMLAEFADGFGLRIPLADIGIPAGVSAGQGVSALVFSGGLGALLSAFLAMKILRAADRPAGGPGKRR